MSPGLQDQAVTGAGEPGACGLGLPDLSSDVLIPLPPPPHPYTQNEATYLRGFGGPETIPRVLPALAVSVPLLIGYQHPYSFLNSLFLAVPSRTPCGWGYFRVPQFNPEEELKV